MSCSLAIWRGGRGFGLLMLMVYRLHKNVSNVFVSTTDAYDNDGTVDKFG